MSLNSVPSGKSLPNDFNVIIEITAHSEPVKYEVDKDSGAIFVDRFMSTSMHYPCNYGYVPHTLSEDGDPVDVIVVVPSPVVAGAIVRVRPVGALLMKDEAGDDAKVLAGGQSLVPIMAFRLAKPAHLIDINEIAELGRIANDGKTLRIGALVRHAAFHKPVVDNPLGALLATGPLLAAQATGSRCRYCRRAAHPFRRRRRDARSAPWSSICRWCR